MATISYQLKGTVINYGGGVVFVDNYRSYDVGSNLTAGSGTITIDAADTALVAALDGYAALRRSGSSDAGVPAATTKNGPLIVSRPDPVTVPMLAQLGVDGTWTTTPSSLVGSTSPTRLSASGTAGYGTAGYPTGSNIGHESRQRHRSAVAGRSVELMYARIYAVGEATVPAGAAVTLRAAVEYPAGTFYPAYTRDGKRDATIEPGGLGTLYVPGVDIPANTDFWVRTKTEGTTADAVVAGPTADSAQGEYGVQFTTTQDHTTTDTGRPAANTSPMAAPLAVTILPFRKANCVAIVTDSIGSGKGDPDVNGSVRGPGGWPARALSTDGSGRYSPAVASILLGISGEFAQNYAANAKRARRFQALDASVPTHAIVALGTNDLAAGRTLAQIQADLLTVWTTVANRNARVYTATVPPLATSTDSWATLGNQTPPAFESVRIALNAWLRDGSPIDATSKAAVAVGTSSNVLRAGASGHPLATATGVTGGYFEVADAVESARDSGKWKVTGAAFAYTIDGTHPSTVGHQAMAATVPAGTFS